jgi:hypothetical protein
MALENSIQDNEEFSEISLENSFELMKRILTNSIYLFNEVLWLKLYDYPNGWKLKEKKDLIGVLGIKKEQLLINTFDAQPDSDDMKKYIDEEKKNIEAKVNSYIETLDAEIKELENRKEEYILELNDSSGNTFINTLDISGNIVEIDIMIKDKKDTKTQYDDMKKKLDVDEKSYSGKNILTIFSKYKDNLFDLSNTSVNWDNYIDLVSELDSDYFRILKVLNQKPPENNLISNFILKIFETNLKNDKDIGIFENYFQLVFDNLFADYWDLDKYEDSNYNGLNKSIVEILKINVIGVIKIELINMIANYVSQIINIYLNNSSVKDLTNKINTIKQDNFLSVSIDTYLYLCLITKLDIKNPNRTNYPDIDTQKKVIIGQVDKILGFGLNQTDKTHIDKIIEFQRYISDNIGFNCWDEIKKILLDGKKMSIYFKMYGILQKNMPKD